MPSAARREPATVAMSDGAVERSEPRRNPMLEEKMREAIVGELRRQAANKPQSLRVDNSDGLVVNGKIDIDDLVMVIAGSVA